jgi:hypothetical protein
MTMKVGLGREVVMLGAMVLAHLLGDYVFQTDRLANWKSRNLFGVLVHGAIVTLCTWLCSLPFDLHWWPYALMVGMLHIVIDGTRVRLRGIGPALELLLFLLDQACHGAVLALVLLASRWWGPHPAQTALGAWLQRGNRLAFAIGYVLLSMPSWVMVHFLVKGTGAESKSLPGRPGEKYLAMIERGLITTLVLGGQFILVPLVVAPRLFLESRVLQVDVERIGYLGELLLSVSVAIAVGIALRARMS